MSRIILIIIFFIIMSFPADAAASPEAFPQVISETAVLIDADTGQVLFDKGMNIQMNPASITKVMTALLALENADMNDAITMTHDAVFSVGRDTSHIALDTDETLTLEQALYAMAIASANDAANGIAELVGGTMDGFAAMMNARAREAGALNTNFSNAHGLSEPDHYTTAYDMAMIVRAALQQPGFTDIFTAIKYEMPPTNKQPDIRTFWRKRGLVTGKYQYEGIIAEKTGWTTDARHTYLAAARRDNRTLIAVVMQSTASSDKWQDATALLDYGFDEFVQAVFSAEELSQENYLLTGADGNELTVSLDADAGFSCLIPRELSKADVRVGYVVESAAYGSVPKVKAVFETEQTAVQGPPSFLGDIDMTVILPAAGEIGIEAPPPILAQAPAVDTGNEEDAEAEKSNVWIWVLTGIGIVVSIPFILFAVLYIRRCILIWLHRRRRRRRYYM